MSLHHASACVLGRWGVLVRGPSGSGKSLLMRELVDRARARGAFARWVADDQTDLADSQDALIAQAVSEIAGQSELRFAGILLEPIQAAARIDLVVDIRPVVELDRLPEPSERVLEGVTVAAVSVPKEDRLLACAIIEAHLLRHSTEN